jgi:hypothetical protein
MSVIGKRFQFGQFTFRPISRPRKLGRRRPVRGIGKVVEYGTARTVALVVGQNKGKQPRNRRGRCARKPNTVPLRTIDELFLKLRGKQIGAENVGVTRQQGRGWYEGESEKSATYEVAFIPNDKEKTYKQFKRNMNKLAEKLGEKICQDSILIIRDDGDARSAASAEWTP